MKETIIVMDEDQLYSKKFCNQASKMYGKKFAFLNFSNVNAIKEYCENNKVNCLITSDSSIKNVEDIDVNQFYILNEHDKETYKVGKKTYIYKLQNIKNILGKIDEDLSIKFGKSNTKSSERCKICLFYSPNLIKTKSEIVKKIAKTVSRKKKILIVEIDEFSNYKGSVGLSNVIYNYKDNSLTKENLLKEITIDKDQEYLKSVTYPEDFNVITNVDLANIVNDLVSLEYDYIFVNADNSYVKSQYLVNDADSVVLIKDKEEDIFGIFKLYLKSENQVDYKKVTIFDTTKLDRQYLTAFCKQHFLEKNNV